MTASKTFGGVAGIGGAGTGVAGIGGAGERRRFESRRSLTYTINARPQNSGWAAGCRINGRRRGSVMLQR